MPESGGILINPFRRMIKLEGALCGGIITGTDKIRSGYGNGDCIYLDFKNAVFAVADGTERYPWASRELLMRLAARIDDGGLPDSPEGWQGMINSIYAEQKYHYKTTFSCVVISRKDQGHKIDVLHGGDSLVAVMDSVTGEIAFQTRVDMNFAGRSREIADVTGHMIRDRRKRIIISTDGFNDLLRYCIERSFLKSMADVFASYPLHEICDAVHGVLQRNRDFEYDDIGFIVIDPFGIHGRAAGRAIIGGTRPDHEHRYLRDRSSVLHDQWLPDVAWDENRAMLDIAGIGCF